MATPQRNPFDLGSMQTEGPTMAPIGSAPPGMSGGGGDPVRPTTRRVAAPSSTSVARGTPTRTTRVPGVRTRGTGGSSGRSREAYDYYVGRGWAPHQAAAIVGNLMGESGGNLNSSAVGDGGRAFGLAQWHPDRQVGLDTLARARGTRRDDFRTQLEYVHQELNGSERGAGNRLRASRDVDSATATFAAYYERPQGSPEYRTSGNPAQMAGWSHRVGHARSFSTGGTIGKTAGALAGQALIPIPGVGGMIGGLVGGVVGNTAQNLLSSLFNKNPENLMARDGTISGGADYSKGGALPGGDPPGRRRRVALLTARERRNLDYVARRSSTEYRRVDPNIERAEDSVLALPGRLLASAGREFIRDPMSVLGRFGGQAGETARSVTQGTPLPRNTRGRHNPNYISPYEAVSTAAMVAAPFSATLRDDAVALGLNAVDGLNIIRGSNNMQNRRTGGTLPGGGDPPLTAAELQRRVRASVDGARRSRRPTVLGRLRTTMGQEADLMRQDAALRVQEDQSIANAARHRTIVPGAQIDPILHRYGSLAEVNAGYGKGGVLPNKYAEGGVIEARTGESLQEIAAANGMTWREIRRLNPQLNGDLNIRTGARINVTPRAGVQGAQAQQGQQIVADMAAQERTSTSLGTPAPYAHQRLGVVGGEVVSAGPVSQPATGPAASTPAAPTVEAPLPRRATRPTTPTRSAPAPRRAATPAATPARRPSGETDAMRRQQLIEGPNGVYTSGSADARLRAAGFAPLTAAERGEPFPARRPATPAARPTTPRPSGPQPAGTGTVVSSRRGMLTGPPNTPERREARRGVVWPAEEAPARAATPRTRATPPAPRRRAARPSFMDNVRSSGRDIRRTLAELPGRLERAGESPTERRRRTGNRATGGPLPVDPAAASGAAVPIGQDAHEFVGPSHEQGGIPIPGLNAEVEGGETLDKVQGEHYVFSESMKVPGTRMSFAEMHKKMVQAGASPKDVEKLAAMQETTRGGPPGTNERAGGGILSTLGGLATEKNLGKVMPYAGDIMNIAQGLIPKRLPPAQQVSDRHSVRMLNESGRINVQPAMAKVMAAQRGANVGATANNKLAAHAATLQGVQEIEMTKQNEEARMKQGALSMMQNVESQNASLRTQRDAAQLLENDSRRTTMLEGVGGLSRTRQALNKDAATLQMERDKAALLSAGLDPRQLSNLSPELLERVGMKVPGIPATTASPGGEGPAMSTVGPLVPTAGTPAGVPVAPRMAAPGAPTSQPPTSQASTPMRTVTGGDNLNSLALTYGVTLAELMRMNPNITNPGALTTGMQINIPG